MVVIIYYVSRLLMGRHEHVGDQSTYGHQHLLGELGRNHLLCKLGTHCRHHLLGEQGTQ